MKARETILFAESVYEMKDISWNRYLLHRCFYSIDEANLSFRFRDSPCGFSRDYPCIKIEKTFCKSLIWDFSSFGEIIPIYYLCNFRLTF